MEKKGSNMASVRRSNRSVILDILFKEGQISRKYLSQKLGLTAASITLLSRELIEEGLVAEAGEKEGVKRVGRKEILLTVQPESRVLIGVNFDDKGAAITFSWLDLKPFARKQVKLAPGVAADEAAKKIAEAIMTVTESKKLEREVLCSVGITVPGLVDSQHGVSVDSFGILQPGAAIGPELSKRLMLPVTVETSVRALAIADVFNDSTYDKPGATLFVQAGTGISSALLMGGAMYRGAHNIAGELGHVNISADGDCRCGSKGCLDTVSSLWAIQDKAATLMNEKDTPVLFEVTGGSADKLDAAALVKSCKGGDAPICTLVNKGLDSLALTIANVITLLDPTDIVLYGPFFDLTDAVEGIQKKVVEITGREVTAEVIRKSRQNGKLDELAPLAAALREFVEIGGIVRRW